MNILENIDFSYKNTPVLRGFDLSIPDTGITLLAGQNGAGKTTVVEIILGILSIQKGGYVNDNIQWGFVPDSSKNIFEGITPNIYFDYIIRLQNLDEDITYEKIHDLEDKFCYEIDLNEHNMAHLSLGQRKKTLIIGALIQNTDALILDEPFSGLDKEAVNMLKKILNEVSETKPCLLIAHDVPDSLYIKENILLKREY